MYNINFAREVMGLINVRLNLLDDTILFLSREGFRLACLSHTGKVKTYSFLFEMTIFAHSRPVSVHCQVLTRLEGLVLRNESKNKTLKIAN